MYEWAAKRSGTVIICGHTHQPIFTSKSHLDQLEELEEKGELQANASDLLKQKQVEQTHVEVKGKRKPCYFNTGCCSFSDGDITGIELENGKIRLVRWDINNLSRTVLIESELKIILSKCR